MDIIYARGEATAAEVGEALPDPPAYVAAHPRRKRSSEPSRGRSALRLPAHGAARQGQPLGLAARRGDVLRRRSRRRRRSANWVPLNDPRRKKPTRRSTPCSRRLAGPFRRRTKLIFPPRAVSPLRTFLQNRRTRLHAVCGRKSYRHCGGQARGRHTHWRGGAIRQICRRNSVRHRRVEVSTDVDEREAVLAGKHEIDDRCVVDRGAFHLFFAGQPVARTVHIVASAAQTMRNECQDLGVIFDD